MPNLRRYILAALPIALAAFIPSSAFALTYTTYVVNGSNDIVHYVTPVETVYGYDLTSYVTIPTQVPPLTAYTITVSDILNNYASLYCIDYSGDGQDCNSGNVATAVFQNGVQVLYDGWSAGTVTSTVTSGASGSDSLRTSMLPAAGQTWGSNVFGGGNRYPPIENTLSVPIVPAPPPSVNLWFN